MAYSATKDPYRQMRENPLQSFGRKGEVVTPSDTVDLDPYAKAIVVCAAGNLVIIPAENLSAHAITFTSCPVGFVPPYVVRRVKASGTTATVATVAD